MAGDGVGGEKGGGGVVDCGGESGFSTDAGRLGVLNTGKLFLLVIRFNSSCSGEIFTWEVEDFPRSKGTA